MKPSDGKEETPSNSQEGWTAVDRYISDLLIPEDSVLSAALSSSIEAELPPNQVSAPQGKMLYLLAKMQRAQTILEIGTLGGYSTLWLARALPAGGRLITIEADPRHAGVARANIGNAGLAQVVELRLGRALDILPQLAVDGCGPFDLVFIDADKESTSDYFEWAMKLTRAGSLIIVDNVVRKGELANAGTTDSAVLGMRRFHEKLAAEPRASATTMQTVGSKGYDGFTLVLVGAEDAQ